MTISKLSFYFNIAIDFKINQEKLNHNIKSPVTHIQQSYPEKELMKEANNLINDEEIQLSMFHSFHVILKYYILLQ